MVLDNDGLYDRLNCYDNLELYARIYSISNRKKVINDLLEKSWSDRKFKKKCF